MLRARCAGIRRPACLFVIFCVNLVESTLYIEARSTTGIEELRWAKHYWPPASEKTMAAPEDQYQILGPASTIPVNWSQDEILYFSIIGHEALGSCDDQ